MNNFLKLSVAAALGLGSLAANAQITVGSASTTGDAILFADIFNGTTLVSAYAGDIGSSVASLGAGTAPTQPFDDANLQSFLATAAANPTDTVYWVVGGAGFSSANHPYAVTSAPTGTIGSETGYGLKAWNQELVNLATNINAGIAGPSLTGTGSSWLTTNSSTLSGTGFNGLQATAPDLANWGQNSGNVTTTGLGTSVDLYTTTAAGIKASSQATETAVLGVSLTSSGLEFSSLGGGGGTPVPVPAALWLLGSGLLGLAGVSRRKIAAV